MDARSGMAEGGKLSDALAGGSIPVVGEHPGPSDPQAQTLTAAHLESRLAEQAKTQEELHRKQMAELEGKLTGDAQRGRVLGMLDGFLRGGTGTDEGERELQVGIYQLRDQIWQGELGKEVTTKEGQKVTKDEAWFAARAQALHKSIVDRLVEGGGVDEGDLPGTKAKVNLSDKAGFQHFDADRLLRGLRKEFGADLGRLRATAELTGSPEAEWCVAQAKESELVQDMLSKASGAGGDSVVKIPVPVEAFSGKVRRDYVEQQLAEEYSEANVTTEPDYRRDLMVHFFRPINNLARLGVPRITIDNNVTIPIVTGVPTAQWRTEKQALTDSGLTIGTRKTAPQRVGVLDELTWMLLTAADSIGIANLALMEMLMSVEQAVEKAVYLGGRTGTTGEPTGAWETTNIESFPKPGTSNYKSWLAIMDELTSQDIPIDGSAAVASWKAKRIFQGIFTAASNGYPLWRSARVPGGGDMAAGLNRFPAGAGYWLDFDAVATTQMPDTVNTSLAQVGGTDSALLWAVWMYTLLFRYRMAVLTVDNITKADRATTRLIYNEFCTVVPRIPGSIVRTAVSE